MHRLLSGLGIGGSITFALFALMSFLIKSEVVPPGNIENPPIEITMEEPDSEIEIRDRKLPKKPEPEKTPPPPKTMPQEKPVKPKMNVMNIRMAKLEPGLKGGQYIGTPGGTGAMSDGDATPMVVIEPKYPPKQAMEGVEGWVRFKFTVAPDGSPKDIEIIDANPKRVFERSAKKAIYKWKFKPRIVDGKAVEQPNMTYTMEFRLADE